MVNKYLEAVNKLSEAEVKRLVDFVSKIERQMVKEIVSGLVSPGKEKILLQKIEESRILLEALRKGTSAWVQEMTKDMYIEGLRFGSVTLGIKTDFTAFDVKSLNLLSEQIYTRFQDLQVIIGRRIDDIYRSVALENLKSAVVGYKGVFEVAENIRKDLLDKGITGFVDKTGKQWNLTSYSEMVARTSTMEVFRQATANEYLKNDIDLVRINDTITPKTCNVCRKWVGKVISLTGKTPGYPTLAQAKAEGMFHPNCIHTYYAFIVDEESLREENKRLLTLVGEKS